MHYLATLCLFLPMLAYGAYLLFQAERHRNAAKALRREKRAHDDSVRRDYGYYNKKPIHYYSGGVPVTISSDKSMTQDDDIICVTVGNDDTRPIPTIEAENADTPLSDVWVNAIEELKLE